MKNRRTKILALIIIAAFLFLAAGADFLHTHDDCCRHDECPACDWLILSICILTFSLALFGFLAVHFRKICTIAAAFIPEFRYTVRNPRSPPAPASL